MERHSAIYPTDRPTLTLRGTALELDFLELAQRHPTLLSSYFYQHFGKYEYSRKLLRRLFQAHAAGLPLGHEEYGLSRDARLYAKQGNVFYPVQVWPAGKLLLAKDGRWPDRPTVISNEFDHNVLCALISYSFESAPRPAGIILRTQADILADERCPESTRKLERPERVEFAKKDVIIPDRQLFGYRSTANGKTINFHGFEADRNTETYATIKHKLRQYTRYLKDGWFNRLYGLTNAPTIPFVTINRARANGILNLIKEEVPEKLQDRFAVKVIADFRHKLPPATAHMLMEPWERVGKPLNIPELLGVTDDLRGEAAKHREIDRGPQGDRHQASGPAGRDPETRETA
jgi:hypothetical protein